MEEVILVDQQIMPSARGKIEAPRKGIINLGPFMVFF